MKIGYARVSTEDQNLALQHDALTAAGCEKVFEDTASGPRSNRKGLAAALDACAAGDVLVAWKLDRLGRTLLDLVGVVDTLRAREVGLKILTGAGASIDTTHAEGKLTFAVFAVFAVFAAFAESERELNRERTHAGMTAAGRRGRHVGRPRKLGPDKIDMAAQLLADRSQREVAKALGVSTSTLREAMKVYK